MKTRENEDLASGEADLDLPLFVKSERKKLREFKILYSLAFYKGTSNPSFPDAKSSFSRVFIPFARTLENLSVNRPWRTRFI